MPGMQNWTEFITTAWTESGDPVDFFLLDARDVAPAAWGACEAPDGTYTCPLEVRALPFDHAGDTSAADLRRHDVYNCSDADEGGPEVVYALNIRRAGTLTVSVEVDDESIDPDVHLLTGDDANACLARDHQSFSHQVGPGRYLVVVDTWVDGEGQALVGPYDLRIEID